MSKTYFRLITILLLAATLFFCRGGSFGMMFATMNDMDSGHMNHTMPCCSVEQGAFSAEHELPLFVLPTEQVHSLFFFVSFFAVAIFYLNNLYSFSISSAYLRLKREIWKCNIFLISLFRTGILHPKIW